MKIRILFLFLSFWVVAGLLTGCGIRPGTLKPPNAPANATNATSDKADNYYRTYPSP